MAIDKVDYLDSLTVRGRYTLVANELLENKDISSQAKIIFIYVLSKPSRWQSSRNNIANNLGLARNTVSDCLKELESRNMISINSRMDNSWDVKILPPENWILGPMQQLLPVTIVGEGSALILPTLKEEEEEKEKEEKIKLSLDDIYRRWLASIPEKMDFSSAADEMRILIETVKDNGYSRSDITSSFKKKILSRWEKSKYPERQEKLWDRVIGEILLSDVEMSEVVDRTVEVKIKKPKRNDGEVDPDYAIRITTDDNEIQRMMEEFERIRKEGVSDE